MSQKLIAILTFFTLVFSGYTQVKLEDQNENLNEIIKNVQQNLQKNMFTTDQSFKLFPYQHETQKGIYNSEIKLNLIDQKNSYFTHLFRKKMGVVDNNMFVTNFILLGLIEASELGYLELDMETIEQNIEALLKFQDKNYASNVPIYNFWTQISVDGVWQSSPRNLEGIMNVYNKLPNFIQKIVEFFGYKPSEMIQMVNALRIPSDNDDSGCNLALGATLRDIQGKYSKLSSQWDQYNDDYKTFYQVVKKYAYRPFDTNHTSKYGTDISDNIDPRTFYYLKGFLDKNQNTTIALFTTWLTNQQNEIGYQMSQPFHTNNVDLTVNANAIFGLNSVLSTIPKEEADELFLQDEDLRTLYRNSTMLLEYGIESRIVLDRVDLALTYYPSEYNFYYYVARNVHFLRFVKERNNGTLPYSDMEFCFQTLQSAMLGKGLDQLLELAHESDSEVYWESFLGNYANITRHEDRLYSTVAATNALLDTFTSSSSNRKQRKWILQTPIKVKLILDKAINFISRVYADPNTSYDNAFFSGSVKGLDSLPFFYPFNEVRYLSNNQTVDPQNLDFSAINQDLLAVVKGYIPDEEYQRLLSLKWFTKDVPQNFTGFNAPKDGFPYWSSEAITQVFIIQAIAKYQSVLKNEN
ncbi:hypothetical protein ABPG74_010829 [Tetrahymena malaccensis]